MEERRFRIRCLLHLLLLFVMATNPATTETSPVGHAGDEGALLAFKVKVSGHSGILDSWNQSSSYCSWEGITCSQRHQQRVVALDLNSKGLTGTISPAIGNLTFLHSLNLSFNSLQGDIPLSIDSLGRLRSLDLTQNMLTGIIPSNISHCTSLLVMCIGSNKGIHGRIPPEIGNMPSLAVLKLHNNSITGTIPWTFGNLSQLSILYLKYNYLQGSIPPGIGNNRHLRFIQVAMNNFSGLLPPSLYNISSLYEISMAENMLHGRLPVDIGETFLSIQKIGMGANRFSGPLPLSLTNLTKLQVLHIEENSFTGVVPSELGRLQNLEVLVLEDNKLILSGNKLTGEIPDTIGNCRDLEILLIDKNSFEGSIAATLKNVAGLTLLNLTDNKLNGSIPGNLASLTSLQELYLAHNNLSGTIPEFLVNLTSLLRLDLSFNNLQGAVPKTGVFRNLTGLSIVGNDALCGGIQQLHLPKCQNFTYTRNKKGMPKSLKIVIPTTGALLFLVSGLIWAGFHYRKFKTAFKKEISSQFADTELPIVSYNDILKGTHGFSEENVLGKGKYGTVYRGTIESQGIVVAVKVFHLQQSGSYKSFQVECEALRRVRHRCLLKIITCCSSINHHGQDFRALVFEYMANGNLDRWIHSNAVDQNGQGTLSLLQRLDIAVDIVDALNYLHNGCQPPVIHCDLKPSNILLNQDMRARVGDFGIARVLEESTSKFPVNSNSSIGIRGSIGYIAPEYGEGLAVSTNGDVFSLGITLIEMFTGRSPTDDTFRDGTSLHYYAEAALPDKVMEIADSNIWLHDEANNNNDKGHITITKECLSSVIQLGVQCSMQLPTKRLSMSDAAAEMHTIRDAHISTQQLRVV